MNRAGLTPNIITVLGLAGNTVAAILLANGFISLGGFVVLVMGLMDALDGTLARQTRSVTKFGAFLDSVTDRYSELIILGGLLNYYLNIEPNNLAVFLTYLSAAGSVLVSYAKARGESIGIDPKVGIFTRVERFFVISLSLLFGYPIVAVVTVAILANVTAIQRILYVRKISLSQQKE